MIIYNITIKVEPSIADEWARWMKNEHIPRVMDTGFFSEYRMSRILELDESDGITFAIQYMCNNLSDYEKYRTDFAPALQKEHTDKYAGKFVAFRTVMEEV